MTDRQKQASLNFSRWNYAHRGLHSGGSEVPENSLPAFRAAVEAGYGAELDVQLSKDGQVVVFHDDDLKRMCGIDARVDSLTYAELQKLTLLESQERIPLFTEVLTALDGLKGPLIVELKTGPRNPELCEKTLELLRTYNGLYCIESFDPLIVNRFRKLAPDIIRGQLATEEAEYLPGQKRIIARLLSRCAFSVLNRPDFIAYRIGARPTSVLRSRKRGTLLFGWTSRGLSAEQRSDNDGLIFELYRPEPKY